MNVEHLKAVIRQYLNDNFSCLERFSFFRNSSNDSNVADLFYSGKIEEASNSFINRKMEELKNLVSNESELPVQTSFEMENDEEDQEYYEEYGYPTTIRVIIGKHSTLRVGDLVKYVGKGTLSKAFPEIVGLEGVVRKISSKTLDTYFIDFGEKYNNIVPSGKVASLKNIAINISNLQHLDDYEEQNYEEWYENKINEEYYSNDELTREKIEFLISEYLLNNNQQTYSLDMNDDYFQIVMPTLCYHSTISRFKRFLNWRGVECTMRKIREDENTVTVRFITDKEKQLQVGDLVVVNGNKWGVKLKNEIGRITNIQTYRISIEFNRTIYEITNGKYQYGSWRSGRTRNTGDFKNSSNDRRKISLYDDVEEQNYEEWYENKIITKFEKYKTRI